MHVWLIANIQWNGNHQHYQFAIIFMMGPLQTVMPLINPSVWFFGIEVKSHDVTTVDEPFRYSIPPPNRSTSFHSISSCPGHTTKLTLCNLTKRGHALITEFLSCSVTIFGWLLSYASPKSIFLNIRNQPFCQGEEKGCVVEHIYVKGVFKLRPMGLNL